MLAFDIGNLLSGILELLLPKCFGSGLINIFQQYIVLQLGGTSNMDQVWLQQDYVRQRRHEPWSLVGGVSCTIAAMSTFS